MKSACVGVLLIIELKNARWNIEIEIICLLILIRLHLLTWIETENKSAIIRYLGY